MFRFGFDIGGTNIAAGLVNEENQLIAKNSVKFPRGCGTDAVIRACGGLYRTILEQSGISEENVINLSVDEIEVHLG